MVSKRTAGAAVALAGAALASEWIVRGADALFRLFYHEAGVDWSAVRSAVGLAALCVGLYFLLRPTPKAEIAKLVDRISALKAQFEANDLSKAAHLYGEMVSIYRSLRGFRITTPDASKGPSREVVFREAYAYLTNIMPLIRDGHLSYARREAPKIIEALDDTVTGAVAAA